MNKKIIYVLAAAVGIGAAVLLFPKGDPAPADLPMASTPESTDRARSTNNTPDVQAKKKAPAREEGEVQVKVGGKKPSAALALRSSEYGQHANKASPSWVQMGRLLDVAEEKETAAKARDLSSKVRAFRSEANLDAGAAIQAERTLLDEIRALSAGPEVEEQVDHIASLITEFEAAAATEASAKEE